MTPLSFARRLAHSSPLFDRLARPPWRIYRRLFPGDDYWRRRQDFNYYAEVVRLARHHVPLGGSAIDVGAGGTQVLQQLAWFERRVALDRNPIRPQRAVTTVQADFLAYEPQARFDLALCLQVLEHLDDPARFAPKLFTV